MKISLGISNITSASKNTNNTTRHSIKTESLPNDIFIKSTRPGKVSFSGLPRFDERFSPFCKDLHEYLAKQTPLTYDDIRKIIHKYVPDIGINRMSELNNKSNAVEATGAYFENLQIFTPDGRCLQGRQGIYINLPETNNIEDRIKFSEFLVHEMTHVLQENSSDRIPLSKWMNDYLQNAKMNRDSILTLQLMPKIFSIFEYNVTKPLYTALNKSSYMPLPINSASNDTVNEIYKNSTRVPASRFADIILSKCAERIGLPEAPSNIKKIIEYAKLKTECEREAISNATAFIKNELGINSPTDLDLRVNLYDIVKQQLQNIITQI